MKKLSLLTLIFILSLSLRTSLVKAQDEDGGMDNPSIVPQATGNQSAQPIVIDESDSEAVSEVDEYDN